MDSQTIELLGRNRLMSDLLRAGLEVTLPARDRGVDLIAYSYLSSKVTSFVAVPIQMKVASKRSFSVDKKYARISNLMLAHVWHLDTPEKAVTYALNYPEAVAITEEMGWTKTASWERGVLNKQSQQEALQPACTASHVTSSVVASHCRRPGY